MLKCLVINTCDDVAFVYSTMSYILRGLSYESVTYYEKDEIHSDYDTLFFFQIT